MILNILPIMRRFLGGDYTQLNNALWQTGRTELLRGGLLASGTIYTDGILKGLFTSFACNDFSAIPSFVPKDLPLLKGTYYPENVINLFIRSFIIKMKKDYPSLSCVHNSF